MRACRAGCKGLRLTDCRQPTPLEDPSRGTRDKFAVSRRQVDADSPEAATIAVSLGAVGEYTPIGRQPERTG